MPVIFQYHRQLERVKKFLEIKLIFTLQNQSMGYLLRNKT